MLIIWPVLVNVVVVVNAVVILTKLKLTLRKIFNLIMKYFLKTQFKGFFNFKVKISNEIDKKKCIIKLWFKLNLTKSKYEN